MVDIIPGLSGGTMALITGIYQELIQSIDNIRWKSILLLKEKGVKAFWKDVNGSFLFPLILGVLSGILLLSSGINYLIENHAVLLWAYFFGLILASIYVLLKQLQERRFIHLVLLGIGFMVAFGISSLSPTNTTISLPYLFLCSMLAIIAMILPGISGAFIFILLGAYQEVLQTIKGALTVLVEFNFESFKLIYTKIVVIGLGIVIGLKLFSRALTWLFNHRKEETLSILIGFMMGALPKIWPWKKVTLTAGLTQAENVSPLAYAGDPQLVLAILLMLGGIISLLLIEQLAKKK